MYQYLMTHGNKRYYKFDNEIIFDVKGEKLERPTKYVVVSDAHTHIERLVFPLYFVEGYSESDLLNLTKGCITLDFTQIAGNNTMMIFGGDATSIKEDHEYLDELIKSNIEAA